MAALGSRSWGGLTVGVDRSRRLFRGFLPKKTTPHDLYEATVTVKPPWTQARETSVVLLLTGVITDGGWSRFQIFCSD
jgi:hypothetical protein